MTTYAELKAAAASLPARISEATYAGDGEALQALEVERATLPARMFATELAELQEELVEVRAEIAEAKEEERATRELSAELQADIAEAQRRFAIHQRQAGLMINRTAGAKQREREIRARIEELAAAQAGYAAAAAAPIQRNMTRPHHIPGPTTWPR